MSDAPQARYRSAALAYGVLGVAIVVVTVASPALLQPERREDLLALAIGTPIFVFCALGIAFLHKPLALVLSLFVSPERAVHVGLWIREKFTMLLALSGIGRTFVFTSNAAGYRPRLRTWTIEAGTAQPKMWLSALMIGRDRGVSGASVVDPMVGSLARWESVTTRRVVFFPGLGASAAVFSHQTQEFEFIEVPPWTVPEVDDSIESYAHKLIEENGLGSGDVVGGISFGGILACEIARAIKPRVCVVIASVPSSQDLPRRVRLALRFAPLVRPGLVAAGRALFSLLYAPTKRWIRSLAVRQLCDQIVEADPRVVSWSVQALSRWQGGEVVPEPLARIHGARDWVFPARCAQNSVLVAGGGHVLTATNPEQVNQFLREVLEDHS